MSIYNAKSNLHSSSPFNTFYISIAYRKWAFNNYQFHFIIYHKQFRRNCWDILLHAILHLRGMNFVTGGETPERGERTCANQYARRKRNCVSPCALHLWLPKQKTFTAKQVWPVVGKCPVRTLTRLSIEPAARIESRNTARGHPSKPLPTYQPLTDVSVTYSTA